MGNVSFGEWLKRQRKTRGWTQKELAQVIHCSVSALRKMEAEERRPSAQMITRLAEIFELPQIERRSFFSFARGDWQAGPDQATKDLLWQISKDPRTNLPTSLTTFIGREKEIEEIKNLLLKYRLVTLAGAGGIGKTRLSLQVGGNLLNDYPNGVWFVALDSLSDPALVAQAVASAFDIREGASDQSILDRLLYFLRSKTILLILDNCEHLLYGCAQLIQRLLTDCPGLQILATSREVLSLEGEAAYVLTSLSIPERDISLKTLTGYESIRLFVERASLAHSSFRLTDENARAILEISRRVDGIPLAIELAAAHTNILQAKEILQQLDQSFSLLASDGLMRMERHQTLQASLDWSWGLLSESEQRLLRQLSVFAGGWTLESAQAVYGEDVLNLIRSLVNKSLAIVDQESRVETRYRFHEMVRQYAHEKLAEAGEQDAIRTRHLNYYLRFSEQAEPALRGPNQWEWLSRLNDERDNVRTALEWAEKTDVEAGLYLSGRLYRFWVSFDLQEGTRWLNKFLHKTKSYRNPLARAKALCTVGWLLLWEQKFDQNNIAAQECLELYRLCGDKYGEIDALLLLGDMESNLQALVLSESLGDLARQAQAHASMAWYDNDYQRRVTNMEEAISLFRKIGDFESAIEHIIWLGNFELVNGNLQTAQGWVKEVSRVGQSLNNKRMKAEILLLYGNMALAEGNYERARLDVNEAVRIWEHLGFRWGMLWANARLGYIALREGNLKDAYTIFAKTAQEFQKDKSKIGVVFTLEGMAGLKVSGDKHGRAACLIGWTDATREKIAGIRPRLEQADLDKVTAACTAAMGETAFSDAYDKGQKMTMEQAVAYALEEHS